jgi:hypothetical protein
MVDETGQTYAYTVDNPVNLSDPMGQFAACGLFAKVSHEVGHGVSTGKGLVEGLAAPPLALATRMEPLTTSGTPAGGPLSLPGYST